MKSHRPLPFRDEASARVAAYESYLDLFTLLSFILIITAFVYVAKSEAASQNVPPDVTKPITSEKILTSVTAKLAGHGVGAPKRLPDGSILLVMYRENAIDKLAVVGGQNVTTNQLLITVGNTDHILNGLLPSFKQVKVIDIAVYKGKEDINPAIFLAVSRWLAAHEFIKYNLLYDGN